MSCCLPFQAGSRSRSVGRPMRSATSNPLIFSVFCSPVPFSHRHSTAGTAMYKSGKKMQNIPVSSAEGLKKMNDYSNSLETQPASCKLWGPVIH